jgi:hypothetical protein
MVSVPVLLPPNLPGGAHLASHDALYSARYGKKTAWFLQLEWPDKRHLFLQYGVALFDGCGGDTAKPVQIGNQPGMIYVSPGHRWSDLIWPATRKHLQGVYGLAGSFTREGILRLARSMERARVAMSASGPVNSC